VQTLNVENKTEPGLAFVSLITSETLTKVAGPSAYSTRIVHPTKPALTINAKILVLVLADRMPTVKWSTTFRLALAYLDTRGIRLDSVT
jgi:hypothetical protein